MDHFYGLYSRYCNICVRVINSHKYSWLNIDEFQVKVKEEIKAINLIMWCYDMQFTLT